MEPVVPDLVFLLVFHSSYKRNKLVTKEKGLDGFCPEGRGDV
jgi:hypothetical protein